ncbi:VacJ family lipoprotein [Sediminicoccus sp. KRV36]|uniref:MlaA family lipoprotein n=1 Tax=Sediminicoccus sp. KRV36 TaxID=3133721 RepID=UPI00200D8621|nr:VacJ family lipoprotein [Sediminicoccus rosea]UPY37476.1 VacJ family lipoprotein [Sediminicoccus rosea]
MRFGPLLATALIVIGLAGCATRPPASDPEALAEYEANNDPLEPLNRGLYEVNNALDTVVLRPAAVAYRTLVPGPVREGVRNALGNLRAPTILMNDLLQGDMDRAGRTASRFLINSTLGLGGLVDVAEWQFGIRGHGEDFGQTLATWGVGEGPYLFLPLLGPSNVRDLTGAGVDAVASPWFWFGQGEVVEILRWVRTGMTILDAREGVLDVLDTLYATSLDPYSTLRSAYRQRREAEIRNSGQAAPDAAGSTGFGVGVGVTLPPATPQTPR